MGTPFLVHSDAGLGEAQLHVETFDSLVAAMDALARRYEPVCGVPYGVDIVRPAEGRLLVGMGADGWLVTFVPDSDDEASVSVTAVGDRAACGEATFYFGDQTLVSRKYLLPRSLALDVVREWWERGELSRHVPWTSELF